MADLGAAPTFTDTTGRYQDAEGVFGEVQIGGSGVIATGQVAVTTSDTLVCAARAGRNSVTISSASAVAFYVGATGVTSSTGLYVAAVAGASITLDTAAAVYAVGASNLTLTYIENY